ncbi:CHC2 zinc finger domain-containing protein [Ohtaekwangia kribbensis]|uniref:CHC2 zinc finger domain-containing protein n=1 Tax=Ohtaekwangia kribbensis TaxID=688913 RepID=A0ABW3K2F5_9BACT
MNIEQAKTIAIIDILDKLGFTPKKQTGHDYWYSSPLRNEKTPSFHVHTIKNIWYDFGEELGGDVIGFVCVYLKRQNVGHTISDALRWLRNMTGLTPSIKPIALPETNTEEPKLKILQVQPIERLALIRYLEKRGIPLAIASEYLNEIHVRNLNTGKTIHALGLKNEDGGYELRNSFFKGTAGRKNITVIRGTKTKAIGVQMFEGWPDYLSIMAQRDGKKFEEDTFILNSLSCMDKASAFFYQYGYKTVCTWMDNDSAGIKATKNLDEYFKTQENLVHRPMNDQYMPHKDVNEWHMHSLSLPMME